MRPFRAFFDATVLSLSLLFGTVAPCLPAAGQSQDSYQTQIDEFSARLTTLQRTQSDLEQRVACLQQVEGEVSAQRADNQLALGALLKSQRELTDAVTAQREKYNHFGSILKKEEEELSDLQLRLNILLERKHQQDRLVLDCEQRLGLLSSLCKPSVDLAKTFKQIPSFEDDFLRVSERTKTSRQRTEYARMQLESSERDLADAENRANEIRAKKNATEATLVTVNLSLAAINESKQPFQKNIDNLSAALRKAKEIDLGDQRRRTLDFVALVAKQSDGALNDSARAVSFAEHALGQDWMSRCLPNQRQDVKSRIN